jgi:hypothetical protein
MARDGGIELSDLEMIPGSSPGMTRSRFPVMAGRHPAISRDAPSDKRRTSLMTPDDDILRQAARWADAGKKVALATVVQTWGSSPRPVGSQLAVNEAGEFEGSVSGGCIEGAVVTEALDIMETGEPKLMEFGVSDAMAWEVGLACGGEVKVFVERLET